MSFTCFIKYVPFEPWIASKVKRIPKDEVVSSESLADIGERGTVKTFLYELFAEWTIFLIGGFLQVYMREVSKVVSMQNYLGLKFGERNQEEREKESHPMILDDLHNTDH